MFLQLHTFDSDCDCLTPGMCLVRILGIGKERLAKAGAGTPDLRCGAQPRASTAESDSVRAFFHSAYTKLGECLPDKFVRRGRAKVKKKIAIDSDERSARLSPLKRVQCILKLKDPQEHKTFQIPSCPLRMTNTLCKTRTLVSACRMPPLQLP